MDRTAPPLLQSTAAKEILSTCPPWGDPDLVDEPGSALRLLAACSSFLCGVDMDSGGAPIDSTPRPHAHLYAAASALKSEGGKAFVAGSYLEAATIYQAALDMYAIHDGAAGAQRDDKVNLYSNLAECRLKLHEWSAAASAANKALELDAAHARSLLRRGQAAEGFGDIDAALRDLRVVVDSADDAGLQQEALRLLRDVEEKQRGSGQGNGRRGGGNTRALSAALARALRGDDEVPFRKGRENAAWTVGLRSKEQLEWLLDCYCLRVDDDKRCGGFSHGLCAREERDGDLITTDFLVFCLLARGRDVVPLACWDWTAFVRGAIALLPHAFDQTAAKEKYGLENVISPRIGRRSLRATGETVYGTKIQKGAPSEIMKWMRSACRNWWQDAERVCRDVGGADVWKDLAQSLDEIGDLESITDLDDSGDSATLGRAGSASHRV